MTPLRLLSLWRQRWGKADTKAHACPYETDSISGWNQRVQESLIGKLPGLPWFGLIGFALPTMLLMTVRFTLIEQAFFSTVVVGASLWIRRFQGRAVSVMLAGLMIINSARYLEWRFAETLGPAYNFDFFVRLGLLTLEMYGVLLFVVRILQGFWPAWLMQADAQESPRGSPRLGVLILAAELSQAKIERSMQGFDAAQWPVDRINFYVLDANERADLRSALSELGVTYLTYSETLQGRAGLINRALVDLKEDLVAILMAGQSPQKGCVRSAAGWLQADADLGIVSTSQHFLLPALEVSQLGALEYQVDATEFLLAKRMALITSGGVPLESISKQQHLVQRLSQSGWGHVCVQSNGRQIRGLINPFPGAAVRLRLALEVLQPPLAFYRPLVLVALLTIPLLYVLGGVLPVQAPAFVLLSYWMPHVLQALLLQNRLDAQYRLPIWIEIRELLLALHVYVLTTFFVLLTQLREWKKTGFAAFAQNRHGSVAGVDVAWRSLALLHVAAWVVSAWTAFQVQGEQARTLGLYMTWSVCVMLMLAARYAVIREMQEIARHTHALRVMPAMIRLANNRTLSCKTANFPATVLRLSLPQNVRVASDQDVQFSIFHSVNEFVFDARVMVSGEAEVEIKIDPASQPQYEAFAQAALARAPDWPAWLPSERVDQILPNGLVGLIERLGRGLVVLWHSIAKRSVKLAIADVNTKWKKKV